MHFDLVFVLIELRVVLDQTDENRLVKLGLVILEWFDLSLNKIWCFKDALAFDFQICHFWTDFDQIFSIFVFFLVYVIFILLLRCWWLILHVKLLSLTSHRQNWRLANRTNWSSRAIFWLKWLILVIGVHFFNFLNFN